MPVGLSNPSCFCQSLRPIIVSGETLLPGSQMLHDFDRRMRRTPRRGTQTDGAGGLTKASRCNAMPQQQNVFPESWDLFGLPFWECSYLTGRLTDTYAFLSSHIIGGDWYRGAVSTCTRYLSQQIPYVSHHWGYLKPTAQMLGQMSDYITIDISWNDKSGGVRDSIDMPGLLQFKDSPSVPAPERNNVQFSLHTDAGITSE